MLALCAGLAGAPWCQADEQTLASQRDAFRQALAAVERGDADSYRRLRSGLGDYPLVDYLEFRELRARRDAGTLEHAQVVDYQRRFPGRFAEGLRAQWLDELVRREDWRRVLVSSRPQRSAREHCYTLAARYRLGADVRWDGGLREFWINARSLPAVCDEPLARLLARHPPGHRMVWDRVYAAFERGDTTAALQASTWLNEDDRRWLQLWALAHDDPVAALSDPRLQADVLLARRIMAHALRRLARRDAAQAAVVWSRRRADYIYSTQQAAEIGRYIALRSAWQRDPGALELLDAVPAAFRTAQVHAWRARTALYRRDWNALAAAIETMPGTLRADEGWQYWQARALAHLGRDAAARERFASLATETTYYGFLAADRLAQPYRFNHQPVTADPELASALLLDRRVTRAREFLWHDLAVEARREWRSALAGFGEAQKVAAAVLAHSWDWHDRAVYTIAGTRYRQDYALRFPMPFAEQVATASQAFALEPALIYGVLRRESAYRADARSRAGAIGLMQLMPATARGVARSLGTRIRGGDLLRADVNIRFGSKYFRDMLDRFGDHQVLAAAAYNAGPHRVDRWLPETQPVAADAWIDTMPFGETRRYVRAVLAYTTIFEWRRGQDVPRLHQRMPAVPPR